MMNLNALPSDVRRALARSELARRGVKRDTNDALSAALKALREGVAALPPFDAQNVPASWVRQLAAQGWPLKPSCDDKLRALNARIQAECLTPADTAMLDSLPPCELSPAELVGMVADIVNEY